MLDSPVLAHVTVNLMIAQSSAAAGVAGAGLLFGLAVLIISIVWLVFPFIVISKFNTLLRLSREILAELRKPLLSPATPPIPPALPQPRKPDPPKSLTGMGSADPATGKHYYINRSGEVAGPVTTAELAQLHTAAEIDDETLVQAEFSGDWQPLRTMSSLR